MLCCVVLCLQIPLTKGDIPSKRLTTTEQGIHYKLDHDNERFIVLSEKQLEDERKECNRAAQHIINRGENHHVGKSNIKLKPPSAEALKRRQTKYRFRADTIQKQADLTETEDAISALSSDYILSMVTEMEEKFQHNIGLIDRITAENLALEERAKELECILEKESNDVYNSSEVRSGEIGGQKLSC